MAKLKRPVSSKPSKTRPDDYVSIAIAYAEEAAGDANGQRVGKWVRLAAKRFLSDLKRSQTLKNPPFEFKPNQANKFCAFIEGLPHVEGQWDSSTIKLEPAQVFFVCNLFGFRRPDGSRRFSTALYAVARKNAKSTLAAAILLACLCLESELGPQVFSAATTGDQAKIVWGIAKKMVDREEDLRDTFQLETFAQSVVRSDVGGAFRPINAKASTQDGLNPSAFCFDELHAHKTRDLYDVLRSASGSRKNPLFLYTTTEGFENAGPWSEVRTYAQQILQGVIEADHFLAVYYALDDEDDDFDESKWVKANPLLGVSVTLDKLREYAAEARQQPGALAEFRIKRLNRRAAASDGWVNLIRWRKCSGPVDVELLRSARCWAAFDLASTRDMSAVRYLWVKDDHWYTWGRYWVPESAVAQRNERGTVRYGGWVQSGHLTVTDGDVTDYRVIERDLLADFDRFRPRAVAFDPWNAAQLVTQLAEARPKLKLIQFRQGPQSFHPAMQALERAYTGEHFSHGGDPVLLWNAANLVVRRDVNMNQAPDRKRSADKIDGLVALLMAFGIAVAEEPEKRYKIFFVGG